MGGVHTGAGPQSGALQNLAQDRHLLVAHHPPMRIRLQRLASFHSSYPAVGDGGRCYREFTPTCSREVK